MKLKDWAGFFRSLEKLLFETCFLWNKEQVGTKRSTVGTHRNGDCLMIDTPDTANMFSIKNITMPVLEKFHKIRFVLGDLNFVNYIKTRNVNRWSGWISVSYPANSSHRTALSSWSVIRQILLKSGFVFFTYQLVMATIGFTVMELIILAEHHIN